jgi:hypothetical protein
MRTQYRIRSESDLKVASLYPRGDNRTILVYFRLPHGYRTATVNDRTEFLYQVL